MAAKALLLVLLLGRAAAGPYCSPGQVCLGDDEAEDGSLVQKRMAGVKAHGSEEDCVQPTGELVSQEGQNGLAPITNIVASGHVAVKFNTGPPSYTMTTFESVEPHVSVTVDGGTLTIKLDGEVCETSDGHHHPEVNVTSPEFPTNLECFDGADFYSEASQGLVEHFDYDKVKTIQGGSRCAEKAGVTIGVGFSTGGTYGPRYQEAGGQTIFYERELANCIGSVKNNTNLPIALVLERDSDVKKIGNAIVSSADCVLVNTENHKRNTWGSKLMGQLSSPWENTIFVDTDVTFCADPSYIFDTLDFDIAFTVENEAGLDDTWLHKEGELYAVENGRVLKEVNAGIMLYRKNRYTWDFLREQFKAMESQGESYVDQPFIKKQLEQRSMLKVQYLPAEFNLRQNNWDKHAVLLRSPVYMIHARLLAMPEHSGDDLHSAKMKPLQDLKAKHGGQICPLLNSMKGPRLFSARHAFLVDVDADVQ